MLLLCDILLATIVPMRASVQELTVQILDIAKGVLAVTRRTAAPAAVCCRNQWAPFQTPATSRIRKAAEKLVERQFQETRSLACAADHLILDHHLST